MVSSVITQTVSLECTDQELLFELSRLWVHLQENGLSTAITQTLSLECTDQELLFEWQHL